MGVYVCEKCGAVKISDFNDYKCEKCGNVTEITDYKQAYEELKAEYIRSREDASCGISVAHKAIDELAKQLYHLKIALGWIVVIAGILLTLK